MTLNDFKVLKVFKVLRDFGRFALITTVFLAERCHALGETAIINEIRFEPFQLPVQQIIGLINQDNCHIGNGFGWPSFNYIHEKLNIVVCRTQLSHRYKFAAVGFPDAVISCSQIISVVFKQFLKTCFATFISLISVLEDVAEAAHPSTMFCLPLRAA